MGRYDILKPLSQKTLEKKYAELGLSQRKLDLLHRYFLCFPNLYGIPASEKILQRIEEYIMTGGVFKDESPLQEIKFLVNHLDHAFGAALSERQIAHFVRAEQQQSLAELRLVPGGAFQVGFSGITKPLADDEREEWQSKKNEGIFASLTSEASSFIRKLYIVFLLAMA